MVRRTQYITVPEIEQALIIPRAEVPRSDTCPANRRVLESRSSSPRTYRGPCHVCLADAATS
eukprot:767120-Hanusia_phi.AAC.1